MVAQMFLLADDDQCTNHFDRSKLLGLSKRRSVNQNLFSRYSNYDRFGWWKSCILLCHFSKACRKKLTVLNLVFREGLTGVRVIRAFDKTGYEANRFDEANKDYTHTAIKVNTIVALMMPFMTLIMSGTNIAITWFGGHILLK